MKKIEELCLKNGLKIIKSQYDSVHTINVALFFKVGALNEPNNLCGITHMTEHMFFRRLNQLSQEEIYYATESIGTTLRGTTYKNCVWFDMTVSEKYFKEAVLILAELLMPFAWEEENYNQEKLY